jgi:hypothetical protein
LLPLPPPASPLTFEGEQSMPGIPSCEGNGDDHNRSWFLERFPPFSASVIVFFHKYKDLLGEMLSDLSHLLIHERMDTFGKVRSVAFHVVI